MMARPERITAPPSRSVPGPMKRNGTSATATSAPATSRKPRSATCGSSTAFTARTGPTTASDAVLGFGVRSSAKRPNRTE